MHKAHRRQHWFTADTWEHPYIYTRVAWNKDEDRYSGPSKRLRIFPGFTVHPAYTSQICHRCRKNALRALRNMPDKIKVGDDGHVALANGTIRLLERADYPPHVLKKFRRHKERPALNVPVSKGIYSRQRIERLVKRNMRQSPKSEMSPDTTKARFTCVYLGCRFEGHAGENAEVNIGRRFLERIDLEKSRTAMGLDRGAGMNDALRIFPSRPKD